MVSNTAYMFKAFMHPLECPPALGHASRCRPVPPPFLELRASRQFSAILIFERSIGESWRLRLRLRPRSDI